MAIASIGAVGCVEVQGGAVELNWSIRNPEGKSRTCRIGGADLPGLSSVRVCWEPVVAGTALTQICDPVENRTFRCSLEHGVTGFDIDDGQTAIWIEPVCDGGGLPRDGAYEVPAPIVRTIASGSVATLDALLIVAAPDACSSTLPPLP